MPRALPRRPSERGSEAVLRRADGVWSRLESALNLAAGVCVFVMMFFVVAEVASRRLLAAPIPGYLDLIELSMATFAFLGIAYCQRLGGHVRMDLLLSRLHGRARWLMEAASILLVLVVVSTLVKATGDHFWRAWALGDSTIDMELPTWPSKLLTPAALAVLWVRLLLQLWGYVRLAIHPDRSPVSVPITDRLREFVQEEAAEGDALDPG